MTINRTIYRVLFFWVCSCISLANAKELTQESQALLSDLKEQIHATVLAVSEIEKKAGNSSDPIYYSIDIPAQQTANFGLVIDVGEYENGFNVLSVTPGSEAAAVGIQPGDRITRLNQMRISKSTAEEAMNFLGELSGGSKLSLSIVSGDEERTVETQISGAYLPSIKLEIGSEKNITVSAKDSDEIAEDNAVAIEECGEISVFFRPPETRRLYPAYINSINGKGVNRMKKTFRLKPGVYQIKMHELIDDPFFTRRSRAMQKAKLLEIEIKENTRYDLVARFISSKKLSLRDEFWEPAIWRTKEQKCEL